MSPADHTVNPEEAGHKDGREVEWQLASADLGSVRRWLADHGTIDGLVLERRGTLQIFDTYLDTDDWRIHPAGFALRIHCALETASDTKYSQGLKSVGLAPVPAPEFAPTAVDASMPIAEVALANLRRYLTAWYVHEPGARLGDDPEELHDLRVAGRR